MLAVLFNVAVVNIRSDVNGGHLRDQVASGPVHELIKSNPATRRALTELKHAKHGLAGRCAALNCAVLLLSAWGQTKTAR